MFHYPQSPSYSNVIVVHTNVPVVKGNVMGLFYGLFGLNDSFKYQAKDGQSNL